MVGWDKAREENTLPWQTCIRVAQKVLLISRAVGARFEYPQDTEEVGMGAMIYEELRKDFGSVLENPTTEVIPTPTNTLSEVADEWLNQIGVYENRSEIHSDLVAKLQSAANLDRAAIIYSMALFLVGSKLVFSMKQAAEMVAEILDKRPK